MVAICCNADMGIAEIRRRALRDLIARDGLSVVSKRAKKPERQLNDMVAGRKAFGEKVAREIEANLAPHEPSGWLDRSQTPEAQEDDSTILIPEYDTGGSMGMGLFLPDQPGVIKGWRVSEEWVSKNARNHTGKGNLAIVTGFGDSMRPLFNPGDPLLVDTGITEVKYDSVYFFRIGEEGFIKRLQRVPTENGMIIRALSQNEDYQAFDITSGMDFQVLARVIRIWCGTDF
jgi:phage repressor protein C with HTH and peptisase S24 domain